MFPWPPDLPDAHSVDSDDPEDLYSVVKAGPARDFSSDRARPKGSVTTALTLHNHFVGYRNKAEKGNPRTLLPQGFLIDELSHALMAKSIYPEKVSYELFLDD
jgi:hypothetical protein